MTRLSSGTTDTRGSVTPRLRPERSRGVGPWTPQFLPEASARFKPRRRAGTAGTPPAEVARRVRVGYAWRCRRRRERPVRPGVPSPVPNRHGSRFRAGDQRREHRATAKGIVASDLDRIDDVRRGPTSRRRLAPILAVDLAILLVLFGW